MLKMECTHGEHVASRGIMEMGD
ncbi:hypothetical protein J8631_08305 [Serratia fonticola]|nr:hypothetical protein [Serratia fonticola]QCR63706.1 hypothetical protein FD644_06130 [Serratia fonticola]